LPLAVVSRKVAADLGRLYDRKNHLCLVYNGVDLERFRPTRRLPLREAARRELNLTEESFAVLLVGNDWANKGLSCLLEAVARLRRPNLRVLVVGRDSRVPYEGQISRLGLDGYVSFLPLRPDVEFYYAAADAYAGPSLEDSFGLPSAEAMACGLPVIVSRQAGVSELVTHDVDGLVLEDPTDAAALAQLIRCLYTDAGLRRRLGENAARTAQQLTWERNAAEMRALFERAMRHSVQA
jgi:UDP-glucose:(heptosyl)LPS alpha-1,3-glucosyltransferase